MLIKVEYLGIETHINKNTQEIIIVKDNTNSKKLFNMAFKAILKNINIDVNNYKIINKIK